jgi:Zn-dependent protease with chaperone function
VKAVIAAVLIFLASSAAAQPLNPESDSDEAGLMMQVAKAEDDVKNSPSLIGDAALNDYVRAIVCRVAASDCIGLRVYILEAPGMTLISLPNGALVLGSGSLLRTGSEAELAHLLAHEIAHYLHKDSLAQFHRRLDTSGMVALVGVAASVVGAGFIGMPASIVALDANYPYSQKEEDDARRTGFELATSAGYDPGAAQAVWEKRDTDFRKRHPGAADFPAIASHAFWKQGEDSQAAALAPYLGRWVDDELRQSDVAQSDCVTLFTRLAQSGRGLYRYGLGEAYRKRGQPGDTELAEASFRAALSTPEAPPLAWRGLGLAAMQRGDKSTARTAFGRYRAAMPNADDGAMIDYYMAQL